MPYASQNDKVDRMPKAKTVYAIAWWRKYAEETAERLPDQDYLMTPCRAMVRAAASHVGPYF